MNVKKKICSLVFALCLVFGLTACETEISTKGIQTPECEHVWQFRKYIEGFEPTCHEDGKALYDCTLCGKVKEDTAPKIEHSYSNSSCLVRPYCLTCYSTYGEINSTGDAMGHTFVNDFCETCGVIDLSKCTFEVTFSGMSTYKNKKKTSKGAIEKFEVVEVGGYGENFGTTKLACNINYVCEAYLPDDTLETIRKYFEVFSEERDGKTVYYYYQGLEDGTQDSEEFIVYLDCVVGVWYAPANITYPNGKTEFKLLEIPVLTQEDTYCDTQIDIEKLGLKINQVGTYKIEFLKEYTEPTETKKK